MPSVMLPGSRLIVGALAVFVPWTVAAVACTGSADVSIVFTYTWTEANETEAANYPSNAHFSDTICALSTTSTLFVRGATASAGFVELSETGASATLIKELEDNEDVPENGVLRSPALSPGTSVGKLASFNFTVTPDVSYIGCVSMIAPSPSWVVGMRDRSLCDEKTGKFFSTSQILLTPYTSGSDTGASYSAADSKADPQGKIAVQSEGVIANYGFLTIKTNGDGPTFGSDQTSADAPTTTTTSSSSDEEAECFPSDAVVTLETGEQRVMSSLVVGDRVHIGRGVFSEVFMFTHKLADVESNFVRIQTADGQRLSLTPGHYIYINGALATAKSVVVGDVVELASGLTSSVSRISSVVLKGLYNPQTLHGNIVVDDVLVSTYTSAVEPTLAHIALSPLRMLYGLLGCSSGALEHSAPQIAASTW